MSEGGDEAQRYWRASLPENDPRFDDLLAYLRGVQVPGRYSPVPRMLGEWALLGFMLQTGRIAVGGGATAIDAGGADINGGLGASLMIAEQASGIGWD